jgi:hypothetical protein
MNPVYYLIIKHDYADTKTSSIVGEAFTDKRNALSEMENIAYQAVISKDGIEHAKKCLFDEANPMRHKEKKMYITKNAKESPDSLSVWWKHDITKTGPGRLYGRSTWTETIFERQFSVQVVSIPAALWGLKPVVPIVTYQSKWLDKMSKNGKSPKSMTDDEQLTALHKDSAKEYVNYFKLTAVYTVLANRLDKEIVPEINLPKIRYEQTQKDKEAHLSPKDYQFLSCPRAKQYVPEPVAPVVSAPVAPVAPAPVENTNEDILH